MADDGLQFEAHYDDAIIDDAARTFIRRLFRKYLWLLVGACVCNIIAFAFVLFLPGTSTLMIAVLGAIAAIGPVYFPWQYLRLPKSLAAPMKRGPIKPSATISVSSSTFTISAKGKEFTRRWADLKDVVECPDYFLLVVSLLAFGFIPKKDMSPEAQQLVREGSRLSVQPNHTIQPDGEAAADLRH